MHKRFIRILVVVPNEVTLKFYNLELVIIHFGNERPPFIEKPKLLFEIDAFVLHERVPLPLVHLAERYRDAGG